MRFHYIALSTVAGVLSLATASSFEFSDVEELAKELAAAPYVAPEPLPEILQQLNYDQYRAIETAEDAPVWAKEGLPFQLEFLHPGYLFKREVKMNLVPSTGEQVVSVPFEKERFDHTKLVLEEEIPFEQLDGYAGFRIRHPLNGGPRDFDEIGSFVGASYFRLMGQDQTYGISMRALALNTVHEDALEEFPDFVEFWIVEPRLGDESLRLFALLDSPSVAGGFEMTITPGISTSTKVKASLFFREEVLSIGLAPLTSMHWFGENASERHWPDWRPEVHDSDGLLFTTWNDETVWRPLFNHTGIRFSHFIAPDPKGFGLLQRDRNFFHYQDLSNPYHLTPSAWVEPLGKWGKGAVRLIELPTAYETIDNVVSFWEPEVHPPVGTGEAYHYEYTVHAKMLDEVALSPNRVVSTRLGVDPAFPDTRRFVVDFDGPDLQALPADGEIFAEITSSSNGYVSENQCFKNVMTGGWRIAFKMDTDSDNKDPVELRVILRVPSTNQILSETWSYQWNP